MSLMDCSAVLPEIDETSRDNTEWLMYLFFMDPI